MFLNRKNKKTNALEPEKAEDKSINLPELSLNPDAFKLKKSPREMSTYSLAFMGDAVYEALARSYIVANSQSTVGRLHLDKLEIVNASGQFRAAKVIFDYLTEDERQIFLRGRNAHNAHIPKNKSAEEYRYATALEALFGYLYLSGKTDRLYILFDIIMRDINERKDNKKENE